MTERFIIGAAATALLAGSALAQQTESQEPENGQQTQIAEQCYEDLRAFGQRIQDEGYWLTGVRGRWGGTAPGTAYYPGVGVPGGTAAGTAEVAEGAGGAANRPLWGVGIQSPGMQIETLFRGAQVLAIRGDQEGCEVVLSELTQLYDEYVATLQDAGVDPDEVASWRQEMMVAAQPVEELPVDGFSVDRITETEVRNLQDEYFGDIEDVQISNGEVQNVVISRGGFLGLGEENVVIPWEALSVTPNMNLFLLDVPEEALEQAPRVEGDLRQLNEEQQAQVEDYWRQQGVIAD